jgi:hypothetical protein
VSADREKICASCGRRMTWRRRWARQWEEIRYCSEACRRRKVRPVDRELERAVIQLLEARGAGATICPSAAVRVVEPREGLRLLEPARRAARRLVAAGRVEILQGGKVVDPSTARGPFRLRLRS